MGRPLNKKIFPAMQPFANITGITLQAVVNKQTATSQYIMSTVAGTGRAELIASDTLDVGNAYLTAVDVFGSTYWVTKLMAHEAILVQRTMGTQYAYDNDYPALWTFGPATDQYVQLAIPPLGSWFALYGDFPAQPDSQYASSVVSDPGELPRV